MGRVSRFDPPAFLPDFTGIPGQAERWHQVVSGWFDQFVAELGEVEPVRPGHVLFYNPAAFDPGGPVVEQAITWNAFPKELLREHGRERALREADRLRPLARYGASVASEVTERYSYRPQNEYCEWHVARDPGTGQIRRVTFTSEPPELWHALGGQIPESDEKKHDFPGDRERLLRLYQELVSPEVRIDDLIATEDIANADRSWVFAFKGQYNPYNKWNTTHGIAHLCSPPNSLQAEVGLGALATALYADGRGRLVVDPDALICCARYGGPDRNSDPTIGAAVNALARLGKYVTLANPVGLYIDHVDLAGWAAPKGVSVDECVRIVRGAPGMIERLVVEVPPGSGFTVSDLTIGGEPIRYGGQIAECITVKLVGVAAGATPVSGVVAACSGRCWIDSHHPTRLRRPVPIGEQGPPGTTPAFGGQGTADLRAAAPELAARMAGGAVALDAPHALLTDEGPDAAGVRSAAHGPARTRPAFRRTP